MRDAAELSLVYTETEREWQEDGVRVLRLYSLLPQAAQHDERRIRRFDRYYRSLARAYLRYCEHFLLPEATAALRALQRSSHPFSPWELCLTARATLELPALLSLCIDAAETRTEDDVLLIRRADTWNLRDGYPLPLSAFFPHTAHYRCSILRTLREEITARIAAGAPFAPDWRLRLSTAFNRENFYLSPAGVHIYYQMYALGGAELSAPDFLLPWDEEKGPVLPCRVFCPFS